MVAFPNCKINLGLNILKKRSDGYHNLESVFFPLPVEDVLEILPATAGNTEKAVSFTVSGLNIEGDPQNNLCLKAYALLKKHFASLPPVRMHLHKNIPMGAGLGGGSADGAFALGMLNDLFKLNLTQEELINFAAQLGSDCPFFVLNKPALAEGRGEILKPIALNLHEYRFVLINPGFAITTRAAFASIKPRQPEKGIATILAQDISTWKQELKNDFEASLFPVYPQLKQLKEDLYNQGAVYASMTGSGSTLYGIFKNAVPELQLASGYRTFVFN